MARAVVGQGGSVVADASASSGIWRITVVFGWLIDRYLIVFYLAVGSVANRAFVNTDGVGIVSQCAGG